MIKAKTKRANSSYLGAATALLSQATLGTMATYLFTVLVYADLIGGWLVIEDIQAFVVRYNWIREAPLTVLQTDESLDNACEKERYGRHEDVNEPSHFKAPARRSRDAPNPRHAHQPHSSRGTLEGGGRKFGRYIKKSTFMTDNDADRSTRATQFDLLSISRPTVIYWKRLDCEGSIIISSSMYITDTGRIQAFLSIRALPD